MPTDLSFAALSGIGEILPGDDLTDILIAGLQANALVPEDGDVLVLCQKIVSKSENRYVDLGAIRPSEHAQAISRECKKDARLVEAILRESTEIVRCVPGVLITRHRLGLVMANAGIDQSNLDGRQDWILLLPEDPDESAQRIHKSIRKRLDIHVSILISDSFGRPWRLGVCGVCIGCAGLNSIKDERGNKDRGGRDLQVTQVAVADDLAATATLLMGEGDQGRPAVLIKGMPQNFRAPERGAADLIRPRAEDLFGA